MKRQRNLGILIQHMLSGPLAKLKDAAAFLPCGAEVEGALDGNWLGPNENCTVGNTCCPVHEEWSSDNGNLFTSVTVDVADEAFSSDDGVDVFR